MNVKLIKSLFVGLIVSFGAANSFAASEAAKASVGKPAPAFEIKDATGQSRKLSDYKGQYVVLEWFNDECPFVKKHYNTSNMQNLQKRFTAENVAWFTIISSAPGKQGYLDGPAAQKLMSERGGAQTAVLLDPEGMVGRLYGARTTPHMYVIDPQGALIYAGAIDDNDSTRAESVSGAKNYVVAALEEAKAGKPVTQASTQAYGCSIKYAA